MTKVSLELKKCPNFSTFFLNSNGNLSKCMKRKQIQQSSKIFSNKKYPSLPHFSHLCFSDMFVTTIQETLKIGHGKKQLFIDSCFSWHVKEKFFPGSSSPAFMIDFSCSNNWESLSLFYPMPWKVYSNKILCCFLSILSFPWL